MDSSFCPRIEKAEIGSIFATDRNRHISGYSADNSCLSTERVDYRLPKANCPSCVFNSPSTIYSIDHQTVENNTSYASEASYTSNNYSCSDSGNGSKYINLTNSINEEINTGLSGSDNENDIIFTSRDIESDKVPDQVFNSEINFLVPEKKVECILPDYRNPNDRNQQLILKYKQEKDIETINMNLENLRCAPQYKSRKALSFNMKHGSVVAVKSRKKLVNSSISSAKSKKCPNTVQKMCEGVPSGISRPRKTFSALIREAILASPGEKEIVSGIYTYIENNYEYFRHIGDKWKNSIRHNLSSHQYFIKKPREGTSAGKGSYWYFDHKYDKAFENPRRKPRMGRYSRPQPTTTSTNCLAKPSSIPTHSNTDSRNFLNYPESFVAHKYQPVAPNDKGWTLTHVSNSMYSSDRSSLPAYLAYSYSQRIQALRIGCVQSGHINSVVTPSAFTLSHACSPNSCISRSHAITCAANQPLQNSMWNTQENRYRPY